MMKKQTLGAVAVAVAMIVTSLASGTAAHAEVPTNDDVVNALELGPLPFSGDFDTTEATWSPSDPDVCPNASSVWFVFTADRDMTIKISGAGSGFGYEPSFTVLTGPIDSQSVVACTYQGAQQPLILPATSGTTYRIMVATCCASQGSNMGGALHLSLSEVLPPPNDDFVNAAVVDSLPYAPPPVDTTVATTEPTDPSDCYAYASIWYEYTPADDVDIKVEASGYQTSVSVSVWTGAPDALAPVGCDSGTPGARFQLTGGQRYWILISASAPPPIGGGLLSLKIRETNEILGVAIDPTVKVTADGIATVSGTVTCSASGLIYLDVYLAQTFKRPPGTVAASASTSVICDGTASWSAELRSRTLGFVKGDVGTSNVSAVSADTFTNIFKSQEVKLKR